LTVERTWALRFAAARGRTHLAWQRVAYPAHVCRGLYLDQGVRGRCTVLMQSVSGGLFEHDRIVGAIEAGPDTEARVRGAASTVVHEMTGGVARQRVELSVASRGWLEWRPMPSILFPGARLSTETVVHAADDATVVLSDAFLGHDASGAGRPFGEVSAGMSLHAADGRLRARERLRVDGAAWRVGTPAVSGGFAVHGALWWIGPGDVASRLERLRACGAGRRDLMLGASTLPDDAGVHLRVLARDGAALAAAFDAAFAIVADEAPRAPGAEERPELETVRSGAPGAHAT
jgi:urease accessory protein